MPWINSNNTTQTGQSTEALAEHYLLTQGLISHSKNFHSRQGEIDLIMRDNDTWVFIEVKYRKSAQFGGPLAAVSYTKQQKIKQCAAFFLQQQQLNEYNTPCRFDVVGLLGHSSQPQITWLKNAF